MPGVKALPKRQVTGSCMLYFYQSCDLCLHYLAQWLQAYLCVWGRMKEERENAVYRAYRYLWQAGEL